MGKIGHKCVFAQHIYSVIIKQMELASATSGSKERIDTNYQVEFNQVVFVVELEKKWGHVNCHTPNGIQFTYL